MHWNASDMTPYAAVTNAINSTDSCFAIRPHSDFILEKTAWMSISMMFLLSLECIKWHVRWRHYFWQLGVCQNKIEWCLGTCRALTWNLPTVSNKDFIVHLPLVLLLAARCQCMLCIREGLLTVIIVSVTRLSMKIHFTLT